MFLWLAERKKMKYFLQIHNAFAFVFLLALFLSTSKIASANQYATEVSSNAHSLGMGNVGINLSRGPNSIFYNPANIAAKDTKTNIQFVNLQLEGTSGLITQTGRGTYGNAFDLQSLYKMSQQNGNSYIGGRYSVFPNFTTRNFTLGFLYEQSRGAEKRLQSDEFTFKMRDRIGPVTALSFRLLSGILRLGVSAQYLMVGDADGAIREPVNTSATSFSTVGSSGSGIVKTGGATLTFPFKYLPSFSLVARNIGGNSFSSKGLGVIGAKAPAYQPMTIDFSTGLTVYLTGRAELRASLDYRDVTQRVPGPKLSRAFIGSEIVFYDSFSVRSGLANGYLTYGIGVKTNSASIDIAVYSEELDKRLRARPDTRYLLQFTLGVFK